MRVVWTSPALRQFVAIQDYIAENNPVAAFEATEAIRRAVQLQLPDNPKMGRQGRVAGTRELVVSGTPYIVA